MPSFLLPLLVLLTSIGLLLIGNGMQAVLLGLRAELEGFGAAVTGVVMAGHFVGFIGGTFLIPRVIRTVGHIRTFAALSAVASVAALGYTALVHPLFWWLLRVLSGVALVGIYMVVESWLNELVPNRLRGRVFATYMTVTLLALGIGLFAAPHAGSAAQLAPFAVTSVLFSLGLLPVTLISVAQPPLLELPSPHIGWLLRVSPLGFAGALGSGVVDGILWGLGPAFWRALGLSPTQTATYMGLVIAGGALLQWPIGHLSDTHDRRLVLMRVSFAAALLSLVIPTAAAYSPLLLGGFALGYGGLMLSLYSLSVAHVNDRLQPAEVLQGTRGLLLVYGVGAALGPMAAGPVLERYGPLALALVNAAVLGSLGLVGALRMLVRTPLPLGQQSPFVPLARTSPAALEMHPEVPATHDEPPQAP